MDPPPPPHLLLSHSPLSLFDGPIISNQPRAITLEVLFYIGPAAINCVRLGHIRKGGLGIEREREAMALLSNIE